LELENLIYTFAPAFVAKRLIEGVKRDRIPASGRREKLKLSKPEKLSSFFWRDGEE
jgi:hypothetical protein